MIHPMQRACGRDARFKSTISIIFIISVQRCTEERLYLSPQNACFLLMADVTSIDIMQVTQIELTVVTEREYTARDMTRENGWG